MNLSKIMQWLKLTFSSSKAVSFNRQFAILLVIFLVWYGFTDKIDAMMVIAGVITAVLGATAIKKT